MPRLLLLLVGIILPTWPLDGTAIGVVAPFAQIKGVDVSHHQRAIDWSEVAQRNEIQFGFVKATEGADFTDTLFCDNWERMGRMGMRRGAYHFFRAYGCGVEQANHFLSILEMKTGDLPPVLDIETLDGVTPEVLRQEAREWLGHVELKLGIKPIIYSNQHFYDRFLAGGEFDHYPLWIARYATDAPVLSDGRQWTFWQYSNEGCVDGISKKVDVNVFNGTPEMLNEMIWQPFTPEIIALP
jgi:lysozyme